MKDILKSKEQLIRELSELRKENESLKLKADNLQSSEEKYRIISSLTTDYVFRLKVSEDSSTKIDMISDNYLELTNRSVEDISTPDLWTNIIHSDDIEKLMKGLNSLISEGGAYETECRSYLPDGKMRSVLVVAHAVRNNDDGPTTAIVGAVKDISMRKQAEEALAIDRALLKTLVDLLPSYVYVKDRESRFILANIACARFMGASSPQELIGKTDADFYPSDLAEGFRSDELGVIAGIPVVNKVEGSVSSDGVRQIILTNKVPLRDSEKNIIGLVGASLDITELKRTEEALIMSESNLQALINNKEESIWSIDNNYNLIVCNDCFRNSFFFAYNIELKLGINLINILSPELRSVWKSKYDAALTGERVSFEFNETINGKLLYFNVFLNPIFFEGKITGVSALSVDITDRKLAEEEMKHAREKAEESDRLKSAFLANMGHEIRTPMNGIMGFSELLKNPTLSGEEQQTYIRIIEKSGIRMLNIINDLIDISKIESGSIAVNVSVYDINEQFDFINDFFSPEAEGKGLKLAYKKGLISNKAVIKTDKEKLNAVLINLIKNAIKFTEKGSIEFGYERKGEYLEFFVKDTGVGIPLNQKDIIFERFRQGSESLDRNYEGAGLGLSISKSYVEMLGGKIWVQSSTDYKTGENGSEFCFTIPYNPELTVTNLPKSSFSVKEEANQIREINILIADDDMASELLLSRALKIFSKKTFIARSGIEAVDACRLNRDIDLILMDIKMPDMDGYEATRLIRLFNKEVIIIAQTAYAMAGEEDNALEAGCNYYISKPIKKNELMQIIKNHFKKS